MDWFISLVIGGRGLFDLKKYVVPLIKELLILVPLAFFIYVIIFDSRLNGFIYWGFFVGTLIARFFIIKQKVQKDEEEKRMENHNEK